MRVVFFIAILSLITAQTLHAEPSIFSELADKAAKKQKAKESRTVVVDGYTLTAIKLRQIKKEALSTARGACNVYKMGEAILADQIYGDTSLAQEAFVDLAKRYPSYRQELNSAVTARYPGSSFDCVDFNGKIVAGNKELLFSESEIKRYSEISQLIFSIAYGRSEDVVSLSDGRQSISFVVNSDKPRMSFFNDVNLNVSATTQDSGDISTSMASMKNKEYQGTLKEGLSITKNELIEVLNAFYDDYSKSATMIDFAATIILRPELREDIYSMIKDKDLSKKELVEKLKEAKK